MTVAGSRLMMLGSNDEEAIRLGEEALAMAEQLDLADVAAAALVNIGSSKTNLGEIDGLELIARGVDAARAANAPFDICRGTGNLASFRWTRGDLGECLALWGQARREAEDYGQTGFARWFRGVTVVAEYELWDWDASLSTADAFIAEVEAGSPHYLAGECYICRSLVRLGRGDGQGASLDADLAFEHVRRAKDPQAVIPVCAGAAHVYTELGDPTSARAPAEECLAALGGGIGFGIASVQMLAWAMTPVGRGRELASALERYAPNPWARGAIAFANGDPVGAADSLGGIGAVASEAYCRLAAARAGDLRQLEPALAFHRSVRATGYVREGESLLAASA